MISGRKYVCELVSTLMATYPRSDQNAAGFVIVSRVGRGVSGDGDGYEDGDGDSSLLSSIISVFLLVVIRVMGLVMVSSSYSALIMLPIGLLFVS